MPARSVVVNRSVGSRGGVTGAAVYNNTVSIAQPPGGAAVAAAKTMAGADMQFANNVPVATGGARVVDDGSGGRRAVLE